MSSATQSLAEQLIAIPSVTPQDLGCQTIISQRLSALGFHCQSMDCEHTHNLWASYGDAGPLMVWSGHTDVVPAGPEADWLSPPFTPTLRNGRLYGRGAADMKAAIAAWVVALERVFSQQRPHSRRLGVMLTSDEEGAATHGTRHMVAQLAQQGLTIDWCVIGEATASQQVGDVIKVGRRGSLHATIEVLGKQGHIAYPALAINPIHRSFVALEALTQIEWDQGDTFFQPTSMQIYRIDADTGAENIIPGKLTAQLNFRFSPACTVDAIKAQVTEVLTQHDIRHTIAWRLSSEPFFSPPSALANSASEAVKRVCGRQPDYNTFGGTSDGRFLSPISRELIELGPCNESIHQVDEHINLAELEQLTDIYAELITTFLNQQSTHPTPTAAQA